jgi:2-polyprenyl-6-methoxyphenol hydroxylase-like FAD-dependent oxidoreductase
MYVQGAGIAVEEAVLLYDCMKSLPSDNPQRYMGDALKKFEEKRY